MTIFSDEKIEELASFHGDTETDKKGRLSFEFDTHGLTNFARAIEAAVLEAQKQEPYRWIVMTDNGRELLSDVEYSALYLAKPLYTAPIIATAEKEQK